MRSWAAAVAFLGMAGTAGAVCDNTGATPVEEPLLASKTQIYRGAGGVWGDGNDRYKILKGIFTSNGVIDPVTTHAVHITLRKNGSGGPTVFTTTLPAGSFWSAVSNGFRYADPSDIHGVRRFLFKGPPGGPYTLIKIVGRNVSLANAPLVPSDTLHLELDFDDGVTDNCFTDDLLSCTYLAGTQYCFG